MPTPTLPAMLEDVLKTGAAHAERPEVQNGGGAPPEAEPAPRRQQVQDVWLGDALGGLWARRRTLLRAVAAAVLIGVIFLLGSPAEYRTGATLMPEKLSDSPTSGISSSLLRQFGGLLGGLDPSALLGSGGEMIPVELYPEIAGSLPVQMALLRQPVQVSGQDTTVTLAVYLDELYTPPFWRRAGRSLLRLPGQVKSWFTREPEGPAAPLGAEIVQISRAQQELLEELDGRIEASLDKKTGVLRITATMPDPQVAAQVAEGTVQQVTSYLTEYRLQKLRRDLTFVASQRDEAKGRFDQALDRLAVFRDRNKYITSDVARTEEQRLEAEFDMAFNVYNSLAGRLEEAKLKIQEETPVFQTLEPVTVPVRKSHPRTLLVLAFCVMAGLAAGAALVLMRPTFARVRALAGEAARRRPA